MRKSLYLIVTLLMALLLAACNNSAANDAEASPTAVSDAPAQTTPVGPALPSDPTATTGGDAADVATPASGGAPVTTVAGDGLPATAGRIAYMGPVGNSQSLRSFLVNADGSGLTPVAEALDVSYYPSLSPDNSKVLVTGASEAGDADIFVVDMATGEATNLTQRAGDDLQGTWSPDGSQIAFVSERDGGNIDLWIMQADGSDPRRVGQTPGREQMGSWSPDGKTIVLSVRDEVGESLWSVDVATAQATRLTEAAAGQQDTAPVFSPDGSRIAFHSSSSGTLPAVVTIAPDGSDRQVVTDGLTAAVVPVWSPDGNYLLYTVTDGQTKYDLTVIELASRAVSVIPNAQGIAGAWRAADSPLPETGFTQGPAMTGVEVDPAVLAEAYKEGEDSAPVKIIEFTDYQCPVCRLFYNTTLPQIREAIESGQVQLIVMDFPLSIHPQAPAAAEAARCAGDQQGTEGYFLMHDKLYENQQQWSGVSNPNPIFAQLANNAGLDGQALQACIEAGTHRAAVNTAFQEGSRLGVNATPTFLVNGNRIIGNVPFSSFQPFLP